MKRKIVILSICALALLTGCRMRMRDVMGVPSAAVSAMVSANAVTATPAPAGTSLISATATARPAETGDQATAAPTEKATGMPSAEATAAPTGAQETHAANATDAPAPTQMNPQDTDTDRAAEILALVNEERKKAGLNELKASVPLNGAAQARAMEIRTRFSHTRPSGKSCFSVLDDMAIRYRVCGENIAAGQQTPQQVVSAWMASPGHRANILNPSYTHMGAGMDSGGDYGTYWCQEFIG